MRTNCNAVCNDIRRVVQRPLEDFLQHFMPPQRLTEIELGAVATKLTEGWCIHEHFSEAELNDKRNRSDDTGRAPLEVVNNETRWTDYATPPSQRKGGEKDVYADLVDIYGQVVQRCLEVKDGLEQTCALESNGTRALPSQKVNTAMPDGVHQLTIESDGMFNWDSTVVAEEYKLLKGAQRSAADEDDDGVRAGSGVEDDEEDSDAYEDDDENSEWVIGLPDPENQTVADLLLDNSKKVIWSMHHTMRTDARRRFTFGITFADTEVRLWHFNRAVIVASNSFHLNTDAKLLIDVYSRFAFATREELGYDLSMERLSSDPDPSPDRTNGKRWKNQYRIMVCGESYITVKTLANQGAENGFGSCTRVFRAYKESDKLIDADRRQYYAIKDNWLEQVRRTEYEIYDDIMQRIEAHDWQGRYDEAPENRSALPQYDETHTKPADPLYGLGADERKKFFVKVVRSEEVKVNGVPDDTHEVIGRGVSFPKEGRKYLVVSDPAKLHINQKSVLSGVSGNMHKTGHGVDEEGRFDGVIPARRHHRTVMEEATNLLDLPDISTIFATLKDASYALFILHSIGMLYRDFSPGNVLRRQTDSEAGVRGVLADLEYIRCVTETQVHAMRTGTADFCALEVVSGDFLSLENSDSSAILPDPDPDEPPPSYLQPVVPSAAHSAWRFRDVHDLESVYWVILWLLLRYSTSRNVPPSYDPMAQWKKYNSIFPHYAFDNTPERERVLKNEAALDEALASMPPDWSWRLRPALLHFRKQLIKAYKMRQGEALPPSMWALVYLTFAQGQLIAGSFEIPAADLSRQPHKRKRVRKATPKAARKTLGTNIQAHSAQSQLGHAEETTGASTDTGPERLTAPQPKRKKGAAGTR
ncbi:hypothetical protein EV715DRAFT_200010 [Schizophyllum commune]